MVRQEGVQKVSKIVGTWGTNQREGCAKLCVNKVEMTVGGIRGKIIHVDPPTSQTRWAPNQLFKKSNKGKMKDCRPMNRNGQGLHNAMG